MNSSGRLSKLHSAATRRALKLRSLVEAFGLPATAEKDRVVAWVVIEAVNLWGGFLRAYYLSGAIKARTGSGVPVYFARTFASRQAALTHAVRLLKNPKFNKKTIVRRDEPAWHDVGNFLKLATSVGLSNLAQVQTALAYRTNFFGLLAPVRNFYAHRSDETCRRAANVGVRLGLAATPRMRATEILCSRLPRRPENVITDWLYDMESVIDLMCS